MTGLIERLRQKRTAVSDDALAKYKKLVEAAAAEKPFKDDAAEKILEELGLSVEQLAADAERYRERSKLAPLAATVPALEQTAVELRSELTKQRGEKAAEIERVTREHDGKIAEIQRRQNLHDRELQAARDAMRRMIVTAPGHLVSGLSDLHNLTAPNDFPVADTAWRASRAVNNEPRLLEVWPEGCTRLIG